MKSYKPVDTFLMVSLNYNLYLLNGEYTKNEIEVR